MTSKAGGDTTGTAKLDAAPVDGLLGTEDSIGYIAQELDSHIHNFERWLGVAAVPNGEIHVADSILTSKTPFVVDAGNDDWGAWVQILGSDDTPQIAGNVKYDAHRINVVDHQTNNSTHAVQIAAGASGAAALSAGTYTEFVVRTGGGNSRIDPMETKLKRQDASTKLWVRNWAHGVNTSTLSFFAGIHEYPG